MSGKYWCVLSDGIHAVGVAGPSSIGYGKESVLGDLLISTRGTLGADS